MAADWDCPFCGDPEDCYSENHTREWVDHMLAGSYNAAGRVQWWNRPRPQLGGRTPRQAWSNGNEMQVAELARRLLG